MKAIVIQHHGTTKELALETSWPDPTAVEGKVVVAVKACALNYHDLFTLRGIPGIKVPLPIIMGIDIAGEIVEVGREVEGWKVGDRILVDPFDTIRNKLVGEMMDGGLAEYVSVGANTLIMLPEATSFVAAAALPVAYGTAYRMIVTRGQVGADEKVLILGASGGVGTCCVQLARLAGAHVIAASSSDAKLEKLISIGASEGINYKSQDFMQEIHSRHGKPRVWGEGGVDAVINFTGGDTWIPSLRSLQKGGKLLTCGATAGYDTQTDLRYVWTFELNIMGSNGWQREDLHALLDLVRRGDLRPTIDRILPLKRAAEAFELLEQREVVGKIVIDPAA